MAPRKPTTTIAKKMAETRKTAAGGRKKPRVVMQNARAKPVPAVDAGNTHTILLIQETKNKATRTWSDYNSLNEAIDAFVFQYEKQLKALNPQARQLTYTVKDLHGYIDQLADLSALVFSPPQKLYAPRGKDFLKQKILLRLQAAAK